MTRAELISELPCLGEEAIRHDAASILGVVARTLTAGEPLDRVAHLAHEDEQSGFLARRGYPSPQ